MSLSLSSSSLSADFINTFQKRIETYLDNFLSVENFQTENPHSNLLAAIRYSVLNGGKRIRPLLVYTVGIALGAKLSQLDAAAGAIEFIHCYSLIHDDLPSMDNDDLRRGKPTCHKVFGEATAILAGDALQSLAFELLSDSNQNPLSNTQQIQMLQLLAKSSGMMGMVGGQDIDMQFSNRDNNPSISNLENRKVSITLEMLSSMHQKKTGALIQAAIQLGAIAAGCQDAKIISILQCYAKNLGLAFQVQDDILDVEGTIETLGKNPLQDIANHKQTFVDLLGLDEAKVYMKKLYQNALTNIEELSLLFTSNSADVKIIKNNSLMELTAFLLKRHS